MNPGEITGWIQLAQLGTAIGIDIANKLKAMIGAAHSNLTEAQINEAYDAIMADDDVRAAIAARAAGES